MFVYITPEVLFTQLLDVDASIHSASLQIDGGKVRVAIPQVCHGAF